MYEGCPKINRTRKITYTRFNVHTYKNNMQKSECIRYIVTKFQDKILTFKKSLTITIHPCKANRRTKTTSNTTSNTTSTNNTQRASHYCLFLLEITSFMFDTSMVSMYPLFIYLILPVFVILSGNICCITYAFLFRGLLEDGVPIVR